MKPLRVWFNKGFSSTYNVVQTIRAADAAREYTILCSHNQADTAALSIADEREVEPGGVWGDDYVQYCLDVCRRRQVDVFWPARSTARIAEHAAEFERLGTRLLTAAAPQTLRLMESKSRFAETLDQAIVPLAETAVFRSLPEFDEAWARLRPKYRRLCIKPSVSVYGLGFRVVVETGSELGRLLDGQVTSIGLDELRRLLGQQERFREVLLLQYLEGPERSIDCLAHDGVLLRAVVRRKPRKSGSAQVLEENPWALEIARQLTARYQLTGVFNVQLRDSGSQSYLLEINPRMSGGLHFACLSGLAFPYWALQLRLGRVHPEAVPHPRPGGRVSQVNVGLLLPEGA